MTSRPRLTQLPLNLWTLRNPCLPEEEDLLASPLMTWRKCCQDVAPVVCSPVNSLLIAPAACCPEVGHVEEGHVEGVVGGHVVVVLGWFRMSTWKPRGGRLPPELLLLLQLVKVKLPPGFQLLLQWVKVRLLPPAPATRPPMRKFWMS